jgi:hypothetical protein
VCVVVKSFMVRSYNFRERAQLAIRFSGGFWSRSLFGESFLYSSNSFLILAPQTRKHLWQKAPLKC